jgi:hypothetical protein
MKKYLIVLALLGFASIASANTSYFAVATSTAPTTGTSTLISVNPTASTTLWLDTMSSAGKADSAVALVYTAAASTTGSVLGVKVQYSQNNSDWFTFNTTSITSTTTIPQFVSDVNAYTISGTSSVAFLLATPTRYLRLVFSSVSATSSIWASMISSKQI